VKKLYLLRHAEAERGSGQTDFERELTNFGVLQATTLGKYMKENNITPELVICSDAARAKQTFEVVNRLLELPQKSLIYDHKLYNPEIEDLEDKISNTDNSINSLMLVSHNPSITALPLRLQLTLTHTAIDDFKSTCKFVAINLNTISWKDFSTCASSIERVFCP
jgi:phosphohistidine phosphatase